MHLFYNYTGKALDVSVYCAVDTYKKDGRALCIKLQAHACSSAVGISFSAFPAHFQHSFLRGFYKSLTKV